MTESPRPAPSSPVVRNLTVFRTRLRRVRVPKGATPAYPRGRLVLGGAAVAGALIVLFLLTVDLHSVAWWNELSRFERNFFGVATRFGKSDWLLIPTGVVGLALLFADWGRTNRRLAAAWVEIGELVGFFFFSVAVAGIITNLIKWTIGRSRPILFSEDGVFAFSPISFDYAHVSFPSGHATTASAAFVALALIFRGRAILIVLVAVFAAIVATSRVGVRAHYPSDVVAGVFVGSAFTYLYAYALGRNGVAFQRQPDGSLIPKTVAIRGILGRSGGGRTMLRGLRSAYLGKPGGPEETPAVEKPREAFDRSRVADDARDP